MPRYIIKKYVTASSMLEALVREKDIKADEVWKDEKQPEESPAPEQIGFRLDGDGYYYSPYMKRRKKKK
jgi:hypothetical protein